MKNLNLAQDNSQTIKKKLKAVFKVKYEAQNH